jgi:hypothetical protein
MNIRINKVLNEFNVGLETAVTFLRQYDNNFPMDLNAKMTLNQYFLLQKEFANYKKDSKRDVEQVVGNKIFFNYTNTKINCMENLQNQELEDKVNSIINEAFSSIVTDPSAKEGLGSYIESAKKKIASNTFELLSNTLLRERLSILYEYEKHYLDILKEYKEEIKFAASIQEDIRKERAKFFAETLKEVSDTLKKTEVDAKVADGWIRDLVCSYTKSLDLSGELAKEQTIETLDSIKKESKQSVNEISVNKID